MRRFCFVIALICAGTGFGLMGRPSVTAYLSGLLIGAGVMLGLRP